MIWDSPLKGIPTVYAAAEHPVWDEVKSDGARGGFERHEFQRPDEMDVEFLRLLHKIRLEASVPMRIISDARPPDQDIGASKSAHKKRPCRAVDLKVKNSYERARITAAAILHGIRRWGTYSGDDHDGGGLHIDAETHPENPSPRNWTRY